MGSSTDSNTKSKSQQSSTTSNVIDPTQMAQYQGNYQDAQNVANRTYNPYTGERVAAFNPTQLQAFGYGSSIANDNVGAVPLNSAISTVGSLANYNAPKVTPQSLASTNLTPYMNPFTSSVIDTTNQQIGQQRQMAQTADNAKATAAGAFGGSRSGVANAVTNQLYDQDTASTDANLNAQNFSQAQTAATEDISRQLAADQGNQGADLNSAGLRLNAGNSLANMSGEQLQEALSRYGVLQSSGAQQQANQQAQDDANYQEFLNAWNAPIQGQQMKNSALSMIPVQQTTNSSGQASGSSDTTTTQNPGALQIAAGLGSLAMAAGTGGASLTAGGSGFLGSLFGGGGGAAPDGSALAGYNSGVGYNTNMSVPGNNYGSAAPAISAVNFAQPQIPTNLSQYGYSPYIFQ